MHEKIDYIWDTLYEMRQQLDEARANIGKVYRQMDVIESVLMSMDDKLCDFCKGEE